MAAHLLRRHLLRLHYLYGETDTMPEAGVMKQGLPVAIARPHHLTTATPTMLWLDAYDGYLYYAARISHALTMVIPYYGYTMTTPSDYGYTYHAYLARRA